MIDIDWNHPATAWVALGLLLCIAELIVPGVFLIWLGIAALATGMTAWLIDLPIAWLFVEFAVLSVASVYVGRSLFGGAEPVSNDPLLNDRLARLIGEPAMVEEAIIGGRGRVKVGDSVWIATGSDAPVGTRLRIVGADNGMLRVEP